MTEEKSRAPSGDPQPLTKALTAWNLVRPFLVVAPEINAGVSSTERHAIEQFIDAIDETEHELESSSLPGAQRIALERELTTWRWLHWGHPEASWACPCGHAHGSGMENCDECGALRPAKGRTVEAFPMPPRWPTFDEILAHGLAAPEANIINGMPWSFKWNGFPVTHENDNCYLICTPTSGTIRIERRESPRPSEGTDALREALIEAGYALHDTMQVVNQRTFCEADCPHAKCEDDSCQCGNEADRDRVAKAYRAVLVALQKNRAQSLGDIPALPEPDEKARDTHREFMESQSPAASATQQLKTALHWITMRTGATRGGVEEMAWIGARDALRSAIAFDENRASPVPDSLTDTPKPLVDGNGCCSDPNCEVCGEQQ